MTIRLRTGVGYTRDGRFKAAVRLDMGDRSDLFESEPYATEAEALERAATISREVCAWISATHPNVTIERTSRSGGDGG